MMFGNRLAIEGELELLNDLHIGSGRTSEIERETRDGDPETSELALVQRDHQQMPLLPSTTLKGALRAALDQIDGEASARLFGEISEHEKDKGRIGRLWIEPATWNGCDAGDPEQERLAPDDPQQARAGAFNRTRVALDLDRAAAADRLLFTEEMVKKGARFAFRATFFLGRERDLAAEDEQWLIAAMAPLVHGLALGKDSRKGQGRVKLDANSLALAFRCIDSQTGGLGNERDQTLIDRVVEGLKAAPSPESEGARWTFELEGDTPFISIGDPRLPISDKDGTTKEITAPLMRDAKPLLWPSSLLGALRARAEWLVACAKLKAEAANETSVMFGRPDADNPVSLRRVEDAAKLSSIERLFGVAGWRGELGIERLEAKEAAGRQKWTSVSIDRFTGGGRDRLLYTTETFIEPSFAVTLRHSPRVPDLDPQKTLADRQLIALVIEDIVENGLMLGHGAAKGFGWFNVDNVIPPEESA